MTPLFAVSIGLIAGALGTLAVDALWFARTGCFAARSLGSSWRRLAVDAAVWAADYAVRRAARLCEPISEPGLQAFDKDLRAHLVYGIGTVDHLPPGIRVDRTDKVTERALHRSACFTGRSVQRMPHLAKPLWGVQRRD